MAITTETGLTRVPESPWRAEVARTFVGALNGNEADFTRFAEDATWEVAIPMLPPLPPGASGARDLAAFLGVDGGQVCACSIALNDDFEGGELYFETCGSNELWTQNPTAPGGIEIVPFAAATTPWLRRLPRTRWATKQKSGTACFFASQVLHGTEPIRTGVLRKCIDWFSER